MDKIHEIREELKMVLTGRRSFVDALLPPVIFVLINTIWNLKVAIWASLIVILSIGLYRLWKRQSFVYAFGGAAGVALAAGATVLLGRAEGFFIPSIVSGGFTALLCLVSILVKRPMVAFTSFVTRRWPLNWYWHPKVRPAYTEVTWMWFFFFGLRLMLQFAVLQQETSKLLSILQLVAGWPATIILLIASYLYGLWRLQKLAGPSVDEFKSNALPPWEGQKRGF